MLTLVLIGMLMLASRIQPVKTSETIYIRADGSVDPPTAPILTIDNVTYIFMSDINGSIVVERDNIIIDGSGFSLQCDGLEAGINLTRRTNVTVRNLQIKNFGYGIYLKKSSNSIISGNNITNCGWSGIMLWESSNNSLTANKITNSNFGVHLDYCIFEPYHNVVSGNNITNCNYGIVLVASFYNIISANKIVNCSEAGIVLASGSMGDIVSGNSLINNSVGALLVWLLTPSDVVYHNNFLNNTVQARSEDASAIWDNGYPSGGNFWSDYAYVDVRSGPNQDQPGGDGIGDLPYVIDANNIDRYPLMNPWPSHDIAVTSLTVSESFPRVNETVSIYVTVQNRGYFNETFTLTVNYTGPEEGRIGNQTLTLAPKEQTTLNFTWTPTALGIYEINAYTSPIPEDINPQDNKKTTRIVVVIHGLGGQAFKKSFSVP
jgi:parallel beta-helix repeat protein